MTTRIRPGGSAIAAPPRSDDALRELAERLLTHPDPRGEITVKLFTGEIRSERGIDIPVPAAGRVVGTAVRRRKGDVVGIEAVIDVQGSSVTILTAYEQQVRAAGWSVGSGSRAGGFMPAGAWPWRSYQRGRRGPVITVNANDRDRNRTELRLRLEFEVERRMPPPQPDGWDLMPSLLAPPGVAVEGGGGGGGESHWSSQASARTDMPIKDLVEYFASQLDAAGWSRRGGASENDLAWTLWDLPAEGAWKGLLIGVGVADRTECMLTLQIQRSSRSGGSWSEAVSALTPW